MTSNIKRAVISIVIALVSSTVLLAKDIDSATTAPIRSGIVQIIPLTADQIEDLRSEREHYQDALSQLEISHKTQINNILN